MNLENFRAAKNCGLYLQAIVVTHNNNNDDDDDH
jgi:hypothetical protein